MSSINDFPAKGRVIEKRDADGGVVFQPTGTNYKLWLRPVGGEYKGPVGTPIHAILRVKARKVYTVPSGGNFITPIAGPPRITQGRVRFAADGWLVVHAGTNFAVELPPGESAIDLNNGPIAVGGLVNVVAQPGATIELVGATVAESDATGLVADKVDAVST
jgi:hypothetical protein